MKKVLIAIAVLIIVLIIGLLSLVLLVNPNHYKSIIEKQVAAQTGYQLNLKGDLSWHIWPQISLSTNEVTLTSAGQSTPLLTADSMRLDVELFPLLSHSIIVKQAVVDSATLNIGPNTLLPKAQATTSQSTGLTTPQAAPSKTTRAPAANTAAVSDKQAWTFALRKVNIVNSTINLQQAPQQYLHFTQTNLAIGEADQGRYKVNFNGKVQLPQQPLIDYSLQGTLDLNQLAATQLDLSGTLQQSDNKLGYQLKAEADLTHLPDAVSVNLAPFSYQISSNSLPALQGSISGKVLYQVKPVATISASNLQLMLNNETIQSSINVKLGKKPNIVLQLSANQIDLTPFFAKNTAKQPNGNSSVASNSASQSNSKVSTSETSTSSKPMTSVSPLAFLTSFDAHLQAKIQTLIVNNNIKLQQLKVDANNYNGAAQLNLTTQLLGGDLNLQAKADGNVGQGWIKLMPTLSQLQLAQLGEAFAGLPSLTGTMDVSGDLLITNLAPAQLLGALNGNLKLQANDLKLNKTNLLQIIQSQLPSELTQNSSADSSQVATQQYTDLGQVTVATQIQSGVFNLTQAEATSPMFKIDAKGWLNPAQQNLDVTLGINLLDSKHLNNSFWKKLEGKEIPLKISGKFDRLSYQLNVQKLLQNEVKQQLSKQLDKLQKDGHDGGLLSNPKAQKLLNNLFK